MKAERILVLAGGLSGAAGVALSAMAAHLGGGNVGTAANILLLHAPALLCVGLIAASRVQRIGAFVILAGLALFCGDLLLRHYMGARLFPMAAPTGGTLMIAGWLFIAASALTARVRPDR